VAELNSFSVKVSVIGLGYLGATHAVAMAKLGHQVLAIEPDTKKLESLKSGFLPFHEPGLDKALVEVLEKGLITFSQEHNEASKEVELHFICVGTPQREGSNTADTSYVFQAAKDLANYISQDAVVVGKSTVPVGTASQLKAEMSKLAGFDVHLGWNPEFLREGTALEDSLNPDRIVIGSFDQQTVDAVRRCYQPIIDRGTPFLELDVPTAELVKVSANAFLATKISFINAMAEIAEVSGADAVALAKAIGYDERIGNKFLRTGIGFGGGCLPKDIRGFAARAQELGVGSSVEFLKSVDEINLRRRDRVIELAKAELKDFANKKITILGISFKPDSDDLRDSPALEISQRLVAQGAKVVVHDPVALAALKTRDASLESAADVFDALEDADLVILGTEWREYKELDPVAVAQKVKVRTVIDGRNVLDVAKWQSAGFRVLALGRNIVNA
jgi:UDPglucose 6-dehydrogenase